MSDRIALKQLLTSLSQELSDLAGLGVQMQHLMGDVLSGEVDEARLIRESQGMDRLVQHLAELGAFLEIVSRASASGIEVDAAQAFGRLGLTGLAARLGHAASAHERADGAGELELL